MIWGWTFRLIRVLNSEVSHYRVYQSGYALSLLGFRGERCSKNDNHIEKWSFEEVPARFISSSKKMDYFLIGTVQTCFVSA